MSIFSRIFDVFSRRHDSLAKADLHVPESTRTRVLLWCREIFGNSRSEFSTGDYRLEFWEQIHGLLQYRHGRLKLSGRQHSPQSSADDALAFVRTCRGDEFLDFLEYIFRVDCFSRVSLPENQLIEELNDLLRQDDLPYHVTGFVKETVQEVPSYPPFAGRQATMIKTLAYPKVIMRENELLHVQVVAPTLKVLQRPAFRNANGEYLEALEDFRKGDFGDCLTKCGSAFESVLKVLCDLKRWPYRPTDTAGALVKIVLSNTRLENYFEPVLMIVAILRNRLSTSHGAGSSVRNVPRNLARYALNATASAILLLAEETGEE